MTPRDLRGLVPPEPMEIILDAVEAARPGDTLSFVLPHFPTPLLPLLEPCGVRYHSELSGDGGIIFHIERL
ncbi:DUF2249 domain-containing protein [Gulbenkiania mobilis]|uniref:DUF2249 domain-containing protein n=1 Tax=Gulbenkiania mobilis TaxID=397457 RepID=UPI0006BBABFC|nr:DUF2249 domain-containing protein [Gulbenkiania mobilis]